MPGKRNPEHDERVKIDLDPETALRALLAVDPDSDPASRKPGEDEKGRGSEAKKDSQPR